MRIGNWGDGVGVGILAALGSGLVAGLAIYLLSKAIFNRLHLRFLALGFISGFIPLLGIVVFSLPQLQQPWMETWWEMLVRVLEVVGLHQTAFLFAIIPWMYTLLLWPIVWWGMFVVLPTNVRQIRNKAVLISFVFTFSASLVAQITFGALFYTGLWHMGEMSKRQELFHLFNAHLKDVCWRVNQDECPKNEAELRAFAPEQYDALREISHVTYQYHSDKASYIFSMQLFGSGQVVIAEPTVGESGFRVAEHW